MSLMHANYMFLSIYIMPRIETELFALVLFLQCLCKLLLLCYSLFISTCSKMILISWLCIPARPCTSITWNLTPQEEVVIMAERLILDLNFKWNPVMHKICTWCWCSFLHPARLFQWYLTCCVDTISTCQTGNSCVEMEKCVFFFTSILLLFEFGSVYQARLLYCVLQRHRSCTVSKPHENTVFTWLISLHDLLLPSISLHFPKTADCCRNPLATNQTLILCKDSLLWSWSLDAGF